MKLFSKRHSERRLGSERLRYRTEVRSNELLSEEARNRLVAEIKFLSARDDFLEWHMLFEDKRHEPSIIYYDSDKLDDFSLAELGYRMSHYFDFIEFEMIQSKQELRFASDDREPKLYYDDYILFDLAEITILFSKAKERKSVIQRINNILKEENTDLEIVEHLITHKSGDDLKAMLGILKDDDLRVKIERFFDYYTKRDYVSAAKVSADIINILYSDETEKGKKAQITRMKTKLANNIIDDTGEEKQKRMANHIDSLLMQARSLNNEIYDIRHTEKSTIKPHNDHLYKMAATQNMTIIEATLTTLKDDFVLSDDWEHIKSEYIEKYKINIKSRRIYEPVPSEMPIDLSEIPF